MDDTVIRFQNVCKKYKIRYGGLRHVVQDAARKLNPFSWLGQNRSNQQGVTTTPNPKSQIRNPKSTSLNQFTIEDGSILWALRDVSFEVKRGEVLGIIGPNGAGKSTILKLLSGITSPTSGNIEVKGKVGALIEVGAGFHLELTGRENIYLNGAILGLKKKEIDEKFDSIVEFSELEKFLDTPVKKYSSGMYVRLGFSVAAHMESEILLVDEVLAVGDASFRTKCYKRIRELRKRGISIVLVSHDLTRIENLSDRAIFLDKGQIKYIGDVKEAVAAYHNEITLQEACEIGDQKETSKLKKQDNENAEAWIINVTLLDGNSREKDRFETGESMAIRVDYDTKHKIKHPVFGIAIHGSDGTFYTGSNTKLSNYEINSIEGEGYIDFRISTLGLFPGIYFITIDFCDEFMGRYDQHVRAQRFFVKPGRRGAGLFYSEHRWELHDK